MGIAQFSISDRNPNALGGGHGGCLCHPTATPQCTPPYACFSAVDMENPRSAIPVMSLSCAETFIGRAPHQWSSYGEAPPIDADAALATQEQGQAAEEALVGAAKKRATRKAAL